MPNPLQLGVFDVGHEIISNPGTGNILSWSAPANRRTQILHVSYIFAADANVADRFHILVISRPSPTLSQFISISTVAQVATSTYGIVHTAGYPVQVDLTSDNIIGVPLIPEAFMEPGDTLESGIENMQATDTITSIIVHYKTWIMA